MPVYDFKCTNDACGLVIEDKLVMPGDEGVECPMCTNPCERLMGAPHGRVNGRYTAENGYTDPNVIELNRLNKGGEA